jgi:tetratricopeptide (TPR) repeat protein
LRSSERHHLKQDQFAVAVQDRIHWASEHRSPLAYGVIVVAVLVALLAGGFYYQQNREQKASALLGEALQVYNAPIVPAGNAEAAGQQTFPSAAERSKAASAKFLEVAEKYSHTDSNVMAKYFLGLTAEDLGDNAKAEQYLKDVAGSGNKDTAALAKAALATLYHDSNRDQDAINILKDLVNKPTNTVPKSLAQIRLAEIYATKDPGEARKIYQEVLKDNADNPISNLANMRLQALK